MPAETASTPSAAQPLSSAKADDDDFISSAEIVQFLSRYMWTIIVTTAFALLCATVYILLATPIYTARAQLLIDPRTPQPLREQQGGPTLDSPEVESQIAVLRSEKIATMVATEFNLFNDPELLDAQAASGNRTSDQTAPPPTPSFEQTRKVIDGLEYGLDVRRVGLSYAIDIAYSSRDPDKASKIANGIAGAYVRDQLATRALSARQGSQWLEERIDQLRHQMNASALKVQEFKVRRDYRIVDRHERAVGAPAGSELDTSIAAVNPALPIAASTPGDLVTLEELESTATTYRRLYESFLQAYAESVQRQSFPVSDTRIITMATRPLFKSWPKSQLVLALASLIGLLSGFAIALVRNSLDRSIWTPNQIETELRLECLAQLPRIAHWGDRHRPTRIKQRKRGWFGSVSDSPGMLKFREIQEAPFSRFSSRMRGLQAAISMKGRTFPIRCIGVASASLGESKTAVAANLAALYATSKTKTLLIDADLYARALSLATGPAAKHGLVEVLMGKATVADCLVHANGKGPDILPLSSGPVPANSSDLLGSDNAKAMLQSLLKTYEIIVIDLPPVQPHVDALAIGSLLDGVVLVAEWGKTPLPVLGQTLNALRMAHATVLGTVICNIDVRSEQLYLQKHRLKQAPD